MYHQNLENVQRGQMYLDKADLLINDTYGLDFEITADTKFDDIVSKFSDEESEFAGESGQKAKYLGSLKAQVAQAVQKGDYVLAKKIEAFIGKLESMDFKEIQAAKETIRLC